MDNCFNVPGGYSGIVACQDIFGRLRKFERLDLAALAVMAERGRNADNQLSKVKDCFAAVFAPNVHTICQRWPLNRCEYLFAIRTASASPDSRFLLVGT